MPSQPDALTERPFSGYADRDSVAAENAGPVHPVPALRGPFAESIEEAMDPEVRIRRTLDAAARRLQLLELDNVPDDYSSGWRLKPGSKYHPLWKLVAQITFGVHLLQKQSAKSEEVVVRLLQGHVDEVDSFLEDTHQDYNLAIKDIDERVRLLQLSLDHGRTFGRMLRNADFRADILHGNDIIDRIIHRTWRALKSSLVDVRKGQEATAEFSKYLDRVRRDWTEGDKELLEIYDAMRGNADGWFTCFNDINRKSDKLKRLMYRLAALVGEVTRRAGIASRKVAKRDEEARNHSRELSVPSTPRHEQSKASMTPSRRSLRKSMSKPLPPDPTRPSSKLSPTEQLPDAYVGAAPSKVSISRYSTQSSRRPSDGGRPEQHAEAGHRSRHSRGPASNGSSSSFKAYRLTSDKLLALETDGIAKGPYGKGLSHSKSTPEPHRSTMEVQAGRRATVSSRHAELESPYMVGHLQQHSQPDVNQWARRVREETRHERPVTSPPSTNMTVSNGGALPVSLEALAGDQPLTSPPVDDMLIPQDDYSEKMVVTDYDRKSGRSVYATPDSEEKQVMSNETFLMLDDVDEAEEDVERYKQAYSLNNLVELDSTAPGSQSDGNAISRNNTQRSDRVGARSRPHSSYSVIDAWRKSRGLPEMDAPATAGIQEEQPAMPALQSIANLAIGTADVLLQPTPDTKRHSSNVTAPLLTQSGSTTSLNSMNADDAAFGALKSSPPLTHADKKEEPSPPTNGGPTVPTRMPLVRSTSVQPVQRTSSSSGATTKDTWKTSHLVRSNSTKSHLRLSTIVDAGVHEDVQPERLIAAPTLLDLLASTPPKMASPLPANTNQFTADQEPTTRSPRRQESWLGEKFVIVPSSPESEGSPPEHHPASPPPQDHFSLDQMGHPSLQAMQPEQMGYPSLQTMSPEQMGVQDESKQMPLPQTQPEPRRRTLGLRKPTPKPVLTNSPPLVEADEGTPRLQRMITSFTPLSPRSPGLVSASSLRPRLVPPVPSSPSAVSSISREALPLMPEPQLKPKKHGALRNPVEAMRGLFKRH